jgi:HSP20 family protein
MSIQRWDPFREMMTLRDAMNSLMEDALVRPRAGMNALTGGMPLDLRENEQSYIVETTLPGAKPENVDISILGDTLRITAEIRDQGESEGERWLIRERRFGRFERALTLPSQVNAEQANADFSDGILRITLPKAEAARPRQIQVRAGDQENASLGRGGQSGEEGGEAIQPASVDQPAEIEVEVESSTQN